ncbi:MAG: hypothetical protein FE047_00665 [Thermoplasmata archaeon]|nr:MAG: hypothetical protein FE047_00665 [Thermoplasmata archaeon]
MKYRGEEKKFDTSLVSITRIVLLFLIPIIAYAIALFFPSLFIFYFIKFFPLNSIINIFLFSVAIVISYLVLIFSSVFSTAFFINVLNLKYEEGEYAKTLKDKTAFKYSLYFALYYPTYKLINIFVLPPIKSFYLALIGCKIGKNVFLAGEEWLADPCVLEIGENTMIGGRALITGHLAEDKLIIRKVKIGKNCLIGGESFIMPGVNIENNVVVGAKSLVTKNKKLERGKVYAGIPAEEIK